MSIVIKTANYDVLVGLGFKSSRIKWPRGVVGQVQAAGIRIHLSRT